MCNYSINNYKSKPESAFFMTQEISVADFIAKAKMGEEFILMFGHDGCPTCDEIKNPFINYLYQNKIEVYSHQTGLEVDLWAEAYALFNQKFNPDVETPTFFFVKGTKLIKEYRGRDRWQFAKDYSFKNMMEKHSTKHSDVYSVRTYNDYLSLTETLNDYEVFSYVRDVDNLADLYKDLFTPYLSKKYKDKSNLIVLKLDEMTEDNKNLFLNDENLDELVSYSCYFQTVKNKEVVTDKTSSNIDTIKSLLK